ncbi:MAG TPA: hypothetical protein VKB45_04540 [Gemmatimonadales bacterium]|nr:hypothetical protein [Gemmatimonadales bacterium]
MKRVIGPLLLVALLVGVGWALWRSLGESIGNRKVVTVRGLVGSEKVAYLSDPRVLAELRKRGIDLHVEKAGSREMATRADLAHYDFAFPAGAPAATKLMQQTGAKKSYNPFFTPMVVASWKPIVDVLAANGIVHQGADSTVLLDMHKLLTVMRSGSRWRDLPHNTTYAIGKSVLISTTDVRTSNSAAMYLSLTSYLANNDNVVQSDLQVAKVLPAVTPLFSEQGYQESSTAGPFEDYITMGMGKTPMVLVYEAQFIEYLMEHSSGNPDMVLLYPEPTVFTKHTLVPLSPAGDSLGVLLENDIELQHLAAEYGLRTADVSYGASLWSHKGIHVPGRLIDVIDPPSYEVLERMINAIARGGAPCAQADTTCH